MNEALLQFIWRYSLYNPIGMKTTDGEAVTIVQPGRLNTDSGPDFTGAKIKVGDVLLAGHVELHVKSSDWLKHGHQDDTAYHNIILHVVYTDDVDKVVDNVPVLEIGPFIPGGIIARYSALVHDLQAIPCAAQLPAIRDITKESWLSRLLAERWEQKLGDWDELLQESAGDWRNLLYWRMAANFGFKVNANPFLMLARSLPINVLAKHHENLLQIEALLFGQAGMLAAEFDDEYPNALQTEYRYLKQKYKLESIPVHLWKFMRMRPANFPTVRIAQFAALVHQSLHLFSQIIEVNSEKELRPLLEVKASEYWDTHFRFDEIQELPSEKHLGAESIRNIIINTVAPIQFLYASRQGVDGLQEKALQLLDTVPAERNKIIGQWKECGWEPANASQSQAMIQLFNNYCSNKRCLDCSLGLAILKSAPGN